MKRLALLAALAVSAPLAATTVDIDSLEAVPPEFRGRWDSSPAACTRPAGPQRLELGANSLKVGGDFFRAESIDWGPEGSVFVASRYAGPGNAWKRWDHFYLSKDGGKMVRLRERRKFPLVRCAGR